MKDTFLSKYVRSGWDTQVEGSQVTSLCSYPGKEGCVQLIGEVSGVLL